MNYLKLVFLVLFVIPSVVVGQKVVNSNFLHVLISGNINEWNSEKNEWRLYWKMAIRR